MCRTAGSRWCSPADPEAIRKLGQYAKTKYYGRDNYFLATNNIYLEIMPGGVSKATGLQDLCALMNKSIKNTIVMVITITILN